LSLQSFAIKFVSFPVPIYLAGPVITIGLRYSTAALAGMPVPETTMDEHHLVETEEHDVGNTRKILAVKPVAEAQAMKHTPDVHLRASIL